MEVEAWEIAWVGPLRPGEPISLELTNGERVVAPPEVFARYGPQPGDYWVVQEDGYAYINPRHVFERKYSPIT